MTRTKTAVRHTAATAGILQIAAKAIGSAMGTLAATTGLADQPLPVVPSPKKRAKKASTKRKPAMKRDLARKTKKSPAVPKRT